MTFFDTHEKTFTKIATVLSRILEIAYTIGMVSMIVALVLVLADPALPGQLVWGEEPLEELSSRGFSLVVSDARGNPLPGALPVFFIESALSLGLMTMVFRNVNLILRTSQGQTKFSQGKTPFQKDNVRMLREIGFFFVGIVVVQWVFCGVAMLVLGPENAEVSAGMGDLVMAILMLCLSQCFALGMRMQKDVDGLV